MLSNSGMLLRATYWLTAELTCIFMSLCSSLSKYFLYRRMMITLIDIRMITRLNKVL